MKALDLKYPITKGNNGYFDLTYDTFECERTKLINLMSTRQYERYMQPSFGFFLEKYLFEPITESLKNKIDAEIRSKIKFWLPNIQINKLVVDIVTSVDINKIGITIEFSLVKNPTQTDTLTFEF